MKDKILESLRYWHESDFNFLVDAILNSKLQTPYAMGQGKALNEFKQLVSKSKQSKTNVQYVRSNEVNDIFSFTDENNEINYTEFPRTMGMNAQLVEEYLN